MDLSTIFTSITSLYDILVVFADYITTLMNDVDYSSILDILSNIANAAGGLM